MHAHFQGTGRDRKSSRQSSPFRASVISQLSLNSLKGQNTLNGGCWLTTGVDNGQNMCHAIVR